MSILIGGAKEGTTRVVRIFVLHARDFGGGIGGSVADGHFDRWRAIRLLLMADDDDAE